MRLKKITAIIIVLLVAAYGIYEQRQWSVFYRTWEDGYVQTLARADFLCGWAKRAEPQDAAGATDAWKTLQSVAESGDDTAQCQLAKFYTTGWPLLDHFTPDKTQALTWARKSADHGNPDAQFILFGLTQNAEFNPGYYSGTPNVNTPESLHWLSLSAEGGNAEAQHELARLYLAGTDLPKDDRQAVKWFYRSAQQGYSPSQWQLADFYEKGEAGLPKDPVQSYMWRWISTSYGNDALRYYFLGSVDFGYRNLALSHGAKLAVYVSELTPEEKARAEKLARQWMPAMEPVRKQ